MNVVTNCTSCHQGVDIERCLIERKVNKLVLTILVCPNCGNEIVVQLDDQNTLRLYQQQLNLSRRIGKSQFISGQPTFAQQRKMNKLTKELIAARNELCSEYNHTSYQFEGKEHKLDIHVPNMKVIKSEE